MVCRECSGRLTEVISGHFHCEYCGTFYKWDGKRLIPGGEADIYEAAVSYVPDFGHRDEYSALRLFDMLGAYSNSMEMAEKIRSNINKSEIQEKENKKSRRKRLFSGKRKLCLLL